MCRNTITKSTDGLRGHDSQERVGEGAYRPIVRRAHSTNRAHPPEGPDEGLKRSPLDNCFASVEPMTVGARPYLEGGHVRLRRELRWSQNVVLARYPGLRRAANEKDGEKAFSSSLKVTSK